MRASKTDYREFVAVKSLMWGVSLSLIVIATAVAQPRERLDVSEMPRPIEALDSVWIEELTTLEVRDAMRDGKTSALILTGGIEQNGPYLATGKHNYVLRVMGEKIARAGKRVDCADRNARARRSRESSPSRDGLSVHGDV